MSYYANNEYIIASNNSMNENKYNSEKMKNGGIRALLKPLLRLIKKSTRRAPKACPSCQSYQSCQSSEEQNSSNEALERKLLEEMRSCQPGAAVFVYDGEACDVVPARADFVPVHFARTDAGTFFWTSVSKADADFATAHCYTECQAAEQQYPVYQDRWVQA